MLHTNNNDFGNPLPWCFQNKHSHWIMFLNCACLPILPLEVKLYFYWMNCFYAFNLFPVFVFVYATCTCTYHKTLLHLVIEQSPPPFQASNIGYKIYLKHKTINDDVMCLLLLKTWRVWNNNNMNRKTNELNTTNIAWGNITQKSDLYRFLFFYVLLFA